MSKKSPILAVGAVIFRGDDVLLIKRGKAPHKGQWSIPGGKVERGESLATALAREVLEETGVTINILGLIEVFEALPPAQKSKTKKNQVAKHYVMVDYVCDWVSGDVVAGDDAKSAKFVPYPEAIERLAWDETRRALAMARDARAKALAQT